jgi:hypothetical protein
VQGFPYEDASRSGLKTGVPWRSGSSHGGFLPRPILAAGVLLFSVMAACCPAQAQAARDAIAENAQKAPQGGEKTGANLSKFEARRIRHSCHDEASRAGLANAAKSAALTNCVNTRFAARRAWNECKRKFGVKGGDKKTREEAIRACAAERLRQKSDPDRRN